MAHEVELKLLDTGRVVDVWDAYDCAIDLLKPGSPWAFTFWKSDAARSTWDVLMDEVKFGGGVELSIDGAPQLNGVIDTIKVPVSRRGAALSISGRDCAGVAIDWDADPTIFERNVTLGTAVRKVLEGLGLTVAVGASAADARAAQSGRRPGARGSSSSAPGDLLDKAHPKVGEKAWSFCDHLCRKKGYLLWVAPDAEGRLSVIVDRPLESGQPSYAFSRRLNPDGTVTNDSNVLESEHTVQYRDVPTSVSVMSRASRGDSLPARTVTTVVNTVPAVHPRASANLKVHPRYVVAGRSRGPGAASGEAQRIIAEANAGFEVYECSVRGHGQDGVLYAVNSVARVRDEVSRLNKDMLVTRVQFKGSRAAGQTTELSTIPLGNLEITAPAS